MCFRVTTFCITESSICNGDNMNQEAVIVVQAIMSIKAIIKLDPATHEKVSVLCFDYFSSFCFFPFLKLYNCLCQFSFKLKNYRNLY